MLSVTKGIVLHHIRYTDSSVIAKVYTEDFGLQSYLIRGVGGKKRNKKSGLVQPLSLVEISARKKEGSSMSTARDIRLYLPYQELHRNIIKCSIGLFLAEVLYKTLKEEISNKPLYEFLEQAFQLLDLENKVANFHLWFLMRYAKHLGFQPSLPEDAAVNFFDLREGRFTISPPSHPAYANQAETQLILTLLGMNFDEFKDCNFTPEERNNGLEVLLRYYHFHLDGMREIKSHKVLQTVLND